MDWSGAKLGADFSSTLCFLPGKGQIDARLIFMGSVKAQNYLQTLAIWSFVLDSLTKTVP